MTDAEFIFGVQPKDDVIYDIETYPNVFTFYAESTVSDRDWLFEISPRRDDTRLIIDFMNVSNYFTNRWVGYNNIGFDYLIMHDIYTNGRYSYEKVMKIIKSQNIFSQMIWDNDRIVEQLDLLKIHHFDNKARFTRLKDLEFNMRMDNIEDLPFPVGEDLTIEQIPVLIDYQKHDVKATRMFYEKSLDKIRFREELTQKYDRNFMNHNDTKIGKDYFIMELADKGVHCYQQTEDGRKPRQTKRDKIVISDIILPIIRFDDPEFNRILSWFREQSISETKGVFKDIECTVNGFAFKFGTGGIHGSLEETAIYSDDEYTIVDIDVASYYPNLAIANRFYPEHLSEAFCDIYKDMYEQRKSYAKGTSENAMLKLALNGVYGDSNNEYSPFYDPQYTMSITVNGQLLLCMLAEALMKSDQVQMIQINTDGLTVRIPNTLIDWLKSVCDWWEDLTQLELEKVRYRKMFIRDVNNYIAEYPDDDVKRKGAYEYEMQWHQNQSALVVQKAAEAHLLYGDDIQHFITRHNNLYDFMLRGKVPRGSVLELDGKPVGNLIRYFISKNGGKLEKVMPPKGPEGWFKKKNGVPEDTYQEYMKVNGNVWHEDIHTKNQSIHQERRIGINTGWTVELRNNIKQGNMNINHAWYIAEAKKLTRMVD